MTIYWLSFPGLFKDKWDSKYPKIYKSQHDNWTTLSTYFKYPEAVRRLIYTTSAIEGFNRQLRKVTKSKTVFPTDDSLLKMLYLAMMDITKKWTGHRQDWGQIHSQLEIYFEERLSVRNLQQKKFHQLFIDSMKTACIIQGKGRRPKSGIRPLSNY